MVCGEIDGGFVSGEAGDEGKGPGERRGDGRRTMKRILACDGKGMKEGRTARACLVLYPLRWGDFSLRVRNRTTRERRNHIECVK